MVPAPHPLLLVKGASLGFYCYHQSIDGFNMKDKGRCSYYPPCDHYPQQRETLLSAAAAAAGSDTYFNIHTFICKAWELSRIVQVMCSRPFPAGEDPGYRWHLSRLANSNLNSLYVDIELLIQEIELTVEYVARVAQGQGVNFG
jgi:hypothetical protein